MRSAVRLSVAIVALLLAAASAERQGTYSPSTDKRYPPLSESCPIAVFSTPPQRAYEELGTYDFDYNAGLAEEELHTLADVKHAVGPNACRLGGNAIIGFAEKGGNYNRAVVIRWVEQDTPAAPLGAAPAPPPAAGPNHTVPAPPAPAAPAARP